MSSTDPLQSLRSRAVAPRLVLFDLDDTLAPTGLFRELRHGGREIDLTTEFRRCGLAAYPGVREAVDTLGAVVRLGLVTSSPRWYAQQVVAWCLPGVRFSPFVTYDDVDRLKPDAEPLICALGQAGCDPVSARYVGNDLVDVTACSAAGIGFIGAGWTCDRTYPRDTPVACQSPETLFAVLFGGTP